ncbi:hypothetical protein F2Q69_00053651 [Brassica cretica]|uniref:Uncharacterized protein n=1 Tax=Brassica cretica TaxID=69181 RepID=A0A8S9MWB4_BRACR|nr:hypothetical protein F2Q69_00053651 [Brassica cretica]
MDSPHDVGVIIEEINEEEVQGEKAEADPIVPEDEANGNNIAEKEAEEEVNDLWNGEAMPNMYNDEYNIEEMYNPIDPFGLKAERELGGKRKQWMGEAACNISKFSNMETGHNNYSDNLYPNVCVDADNISLCGRGVIRSTLQREFSYFAAA